MIRSLLAAGILMLAIIPARAECRDTPHNRAACGTDIRANCYWEAVGGDIVRVVACLQHNRRQLHPACATALRVCERHRRPIKSASGEHADAPTE